MVVRVFTVRVRPDAVDSYERLLREVSVPTITAQPGLLALHVGRPGEGSPRDFVVVSIWRDAESMRAFTGPDRGPVTLGDEAELVESTTAEHFESLLEWRAEDGPLDPMGRPVPVTTADLVSRVEEGWSSARPAIGRLAEDGLERTTSAGWTYRALALHVAAWHELTVQRLTSWLDSGERPPSPDVDAFNARVAEEAASAADAEVLRRLDRSYGAFLERVRSLPVDRLAELELWPILVVAANSYGHYLEHAEEIGTG